jgi:hypothetical protein
MTLKKQSSESIDKFFQRVKNDYTPKEQYQGITLEDVETLLRKIDRYSADIRDAVWTLLNDEFPSPFAKAEGYTLTNGASIAHIGGYIGILLRDGNRLDREGRDYWIKPLRDIGAIETITYDSKAKSFLPGHLKSKSPNSAYRLDSTFIELLKKVNQADFADHLNKWIADDQLRHRLAVHAAAADAVKSSSASSSHQKLIQDSIKIYATHFLPDYEAVYIDDSDGDRITEEDKNKLQSLGITIELDDVWPDVILVNEKENALWFIEAVTSDGEVDLQKMQGLQKICNKCGKKLGGATTTYSNYKTFAVRQAKNKNLTTGSHVWIKEDPEKEFIVN